MTIKEQEREARALEKKRKLMEMQQQIIMEKEHRVN